MGKRKKTQLKPVARGFATTSVPSKKAVAEAESPTQEEPTLNPTNQNVATENARGFTDAQMSLESGSHAQEVAQEKILQGLVDKLQEKTEREIGRTLKVCIR
jgi:ATP-dependent RNA helicase DHX29